MAEMYRSRPDDEDPRVQLAAQEVRRREVERELLAALPSSKRPGARLLLRLARDRIPLRGVAKRSFLQAIDVARGSARRIGEHLVRDGTLEDRDDVFYLTKAELFAPSRADVRELVVARRELRRSYQQLKFATNEWHGMPDVSRSDGGSPDDVKRITGTGVSQGVVEGWARVLLSPEFDDVQPDEILIAPTTDPSWASVMFVSTGLVVDIGGALSHAAVVARELGIPCVVNTRIGTDTLRTGDRIRVDGAAGTVEVLQRAGKRRAN
jgi:pyruvate,water dikinase